MTKRIYKYTLNTSGPTEIRMPLLGEVLSVDDQEGVLFVWVLVNLKVSSGIRTFYTALTGHDLPKPLGHYIGTIQSANGAYVTHIFDQGEVLADG